MAYELIKRITDDASFSNRTYLLSAGSLLRLQHSKPACFHRNPACRQASEAFPNGRNLTTSYDPRSPGSLFTCFHHVILVSVYRFQKEEEQSSNNYSFLRNGNFDTVGVAKQRFYQRRFSSIASTNETYLALKT